MAKKYLNFYLKRTDLSVISGGQLSYEFQKNEGNAV